MREKLIELLQDSVDENVDTDDVYVGYEVNYDNIADHLIANGVTIQEWIPVSEGLPDERHVLAVIRENGYERVAFAIYSNGRWWDSYYFKYADVAYWMYIPELPKAPGEEDA